MKPPPYAFHIDAIEGTNTKIPMEIPKQIDQSIHLPPKF